MLFFSKNSYFHDSIPLSYQLAHVITSIVVDNNVHCITSSVCMCSVQQLYSHTDLML